MRRKLAPRSDVRDITLSRGFGGLRYLLAFGAWSNLAVSPVLAMLPAWYGDLLGPDRRRPSGRAAPSPRTPWE
ncbi:hypothetical protein ACGF7U_31135 [Micromonospora sp. NPDC047670]|uniref:hypothetical protein n=1 Tax=Micromonospora sp. NPDC047670 TaxID=3364252 RepID=UPI00371E8F4F